MVQKLLVAYKLLAVHKRLDVPNMLLSPAQFSCRYVVGGDKYTRGIICFCFLSGVPAWGSMEVYSIAVGFSPVLYC